MCTKRDGGATEELDMIKTNTGLIYRRIFQWKSIDRGSNATVITKKMKSQTYGIVFPWDVAWEYDTRVLEKKLWMYILFFSVQVLDRGHSLCTDWHLIGFTPSRFCLIDFFQRLQVSVNLWTVLFFPVFGDFVETNQGFIVWNF